MAGRNTVEIIISARDQASRAVRSAFGGVESSASKAMGAISAGAKIAGAAMLTLTGIIGKVGVAYNAASEQSLIAWETIQGSAEQAVKTVAKLTEMGAKTPFEFEGLDKAAKLLDMAGFKGDDLFTTLTKVGDAVSAIGGGEAELSGISLALFQIATKGKISAQEMNQLAERGIPAWDMLAQGMGKSVQEVMKMSENGKLFAKEALPLIINQMGEKFGGAMEKQSHTFNGMISTAKDYFKIISGELSKPLFEKLKAGMETVMPFVEKFISSLQTKGIGGTFKDIFPPAVVQGATIAAGALNQAKMAVQALFEFIKGDNIDGITILTKMGLSPEMVVSITKTIVGIKNEIGNFITEYVGYVKSLFSGEGNLGESFLRIFENVKSIAMPILEDAVSFIKRILSNLKAFWDENGAQIIAAVKNVWSIIASIFEFIAPVILAVLKMLWGSVKGLIEGVLNVIMGLVKVFAGLFTGDFSKMWEGIKQIFFGAIEAVWNWINLLMFGRILGGIKAFISKGVTSFAEFWPKVVEVFKNLDTHVWNIFTGFVSKILGIMKGFVDEGVRIFGTLRTFGAGIFESLWAAVRTVASNMASGVVGFFQNIFTGAKLHFEGLLQSVKTIFGAVKDAITNPIETAKTLVGKAIEAIKGFFTGLGKNIKIPLPHFDVKMGSKKIMGKDVPWPDLDISWYDKGGVFYGPQVIGVGERRPEFVGALDDLRKIVREESGGKGNTIVNVYGNNVDITEERLVRVLQRAEVLYG